MKHPTILLLPLLLTTPAAHAEGTPEATDNESASVSSGNPYQEFVKNYDEASLSWQSTYFSRRDLLLSCKARRFANLGSSVNTPRESTGNQHEVSDIELHRSHLLKEYLKNLSRRGTFDDRNEARNSDGMRFKKSVLQAGNIIKKPFAVQDSDDACARTFESLLNQVQLRIMSLEKIEKDINGSSLGKLRRSGIEKRFEDRHKKIDVNQDPFAIGKANKQEICVLPYTKALSALKNSHNDVVKSLDAFNQKLDGDIRKLRSYREELKARHDRCISAPTRTSTKTSTETDPDISTGGPSEAGIPQ